MFKRYENILEKIKLIFSYAGEHFGQHRENKFIEHDHDIDIGIVRPHFNKSIINKIVDSGLFKFRKNLEN